MKPEEQNKEVSEIIKEGEKVTGNEQSTETELYESTGTNENEGPSHEADSQSESKKEDMESYNEHPDQVKVGGG